MSVYPAPRNEDQIRAAAKNSRLFPDVTSSSVQKFAKAKKLAEQGIQLNNLKRRRLIQESRYNAELELQRLRADLEQNRMLGLRGTAARIAQLEDIAQQVNGM